MTKVIIPSHLQLMNPVIQALKSLGGSGTIEEINNKVAELLGFSSEQLEVLHDPEKGAQTEIEYRLAWAKILKKLRPSLKAGRTFREPPKNGSVRI